MSELALQDAHEPVAAVPDSKEVRAQRLLNVWCSVHGCTAEEIPRILGRAPKNSLVGTLAYAIRRRVGLDPTPTARLLRIHTGDLLRLMAHMVHHIDTLGNANEMDQFKKLLAAVNADGAPKKPSTGELGAKRKAQLEAKLKEQGEEFIAKTLLCLGDATRDDVLGPSPTPEASQARYIVIAVLYHMVVESSYQGLVARYLRKAHNTVCIAVARVHKELTNPLVTPFKTKILKVCMLFEFDPKKM